MKQDIHKKEKVLEILAYIDCMPRRLFSKLLADCGFNSVYRGLFESKAKRVVIKKLVAVKLFDGENWFFVKKMPGIVQKSLRMLLNVLKRINKFKRTQSVYGLIRAGLGTSVTRHALYTTWRPVRVDISNSGILGVGWVIDASIIVYIEWNDKERLYFIKDYWFSLGSCHSDNFSACFRFADKNND